MKTQPPPPLLAGVVGDGAGGVKMSEVLHRRTERALEDAIDRGESRGVLEAARWIAGGRLAARPWGQLTPEEIAVTCKARDFGWNIFRHACMSSRGRGGDLGTLAQLKEIFALELGGEEDENPEEEREDLWETFNNLCLNGQLETARWVKEAFGLTVEGFRETGGWALTWACEYGGKTGDLRVARWLKEAFGLTAEDALARDSDTLACILVSMDPFKLEVARWLKSEFALPAGDVDAGGLFKLCLSVGCLESGRWLKEEYALSAEEAGAAAALEYACSEGDAEIVRWLVSPEGFGDALSGVVGSSFLRVVRGQLSIAHKRAGLQRPEPVGANADHLGVASALFERLKSGGAPPGGAAADELCEIALAEVLQAPHGQGLDVMARMLASTIGLRLDPGRIREAGRIAAGRGHREMVRWLRALPPSEGPPAE